MTFVKPNILHCDTCPEHFEADDADGLAALLDREMGEQGHTKVLRIDHAGATVEP